MKLLLFLIVNENKQKLIIQQLERTESYGTYTQWNITQPLKRLHLNQF